MEKFGDHTEKKKLKIEIKVQINSKYVSKTKL